MSEMHKYVYEGPVMAFDKCVDQHWKSETYAVSEQKAKSNLAYQFKKLTKRNAYANVTLPGKIRRVN